MSSWKIFAPLVFVSATLASPAKRGFHSPRFLKVVSSSTGWSGKPRRNWRSLPIGQRTAAVGQALVGTRYKHFTLEIDNRIEAPSANLTGMDCWTFFEISLAFARMLDEPDSNWSPETMLHYIELDRYRDGECNGEYLSRLHYLEDWLYDNNRRGLVTDLTRELGGKSVPHSAREMSQGWRHYRYLAANRALLGPLGRMEADVSSRPLYQIPESHVAKIEPKLQSGDIIGIVSRDRGGLYSTSHVGLALRTSDGVLHFMHASAPNNYGKVVIDSRLFGLLGAISKRQRHSGGAAVEVRKRRHSSAANETRSFGGCSEVESLPQSPLSR